MRYKEHKGIANRKIFYRLAKTVQYSIFAHRKAVEEKILLSGSIKNFFNYSMSRLHPFVSTGPIKDNTNNLINCDLGKAELFSEFFRSVYTLDDNCSPIFANRTYSVMPNPIFTVADVKRALMETKSSNSCDSDGVPPLFLKMSLELSEPLCNLFNMSIQQGCVPKVWKIAKVIPIFEGKGSMLEVKNYRPISLTNVYCKTFERLVRSKIMSYLESENLLST